MSAPIHCNRERIKRVSRRMFLGSTSAVLALSGYAKSLLAAEPPTKTPKIVVGAHPWVFAASQPNHDITPILGDIFSDMQYAGMDGIELMHTALRPDDAVERIGELAEKHRLPVIGTSFSGLMWDRTQHQAVFEDAEKVITRLAKLGGRTLGTSVGPAPQKKTSEQLDNQAELLRRIIALCQHNGVTLNLHNHQYEVVDDFYDLKGTIARIPDVILGPDLCHLLRAGVDPAGFLRQFRDRIVFMHLRNQYANGRWSESLYEGDMDYPGIFQTIQDIHFEGDAVIELAFEDNFTPTRPIRESLKMSRDYARKMLGS